MVCEGLERDFSVNVHARIASVAVSSPILLLGFWVARGLDLQRSNELISVPTTLRGILLLSVVIFVAGEIAYFTAFKGRISRLVHYLAFFCFMYILFQLSWFIDLATPIWSADASRSSVALTSGATSSLRWFVGISWSFFTLATLWMLVRSQSKKDRNHHK